jgi:tetratricopeptide (TPR) repeat protein
MSLGVVLAHQHHHAGAVTAFHRALDLKPDLPEAYTKLGYALRELGRWDEAIDACQRAIALKPDGTEAHNILGIALASQGRLDEAIDAYRRALDFGPDDPDVHNNLCAAFIARRQLREAEKACRRAIALKPDFAGAWTNLGTVLGESGQLDESIAAYHRAIALAPNLADIHYNLGATLAEKGLFREAIDAYLRALEIKPDSPDTHSNLGVALAEMGQVDEAMACYEKALALNPRFSHAHLNLAVALCFQGRFDEAEPGYRRAVACDPESANAHVSLSVLLLLRGHYEEGWREYEWRRRVPRHSRHQRHFSVPRWQGETAIGKRILIHAEQGFGDTLQLVRYLPMALRQAGASQVIFECQAALLPLLRQLQSPDLEIVARTASTEALPPFDLELSLFSLPGVLRCHEPVPMRDPYLQADPALRAQWRARLASAPGLKVGLVWAGNPKHENDRRRSIPVEKLLPIIRLPGIRFVSLQVSSDDSTAANLSAEGVLDFRSNLTDFSESAALMAELDLIVTVDTAAAHLAGALGRPVWTLIPFVPDWRWGLDRDNTAWYPTMRLFRQTRIGDWEAVLARVAATLRDQVT